MPDDILLIRVVGTPAPQGSKRPVRMGKGGRIGLVESSKAVAPWREAVRGETQRVILGVAGPWPPYSEPVAVYLSFFMARPAGHYRTGRYADQVRDSAPRYPGKYPDLDKLIRSTLDGLVTGRALTDDGLVVRLHVSEDYDVPLGKHRADATAPGVFITIERMS